MEGLIIPDITLVSTRKDLANLCHHLSSQGEFSFDTEYDSFTRTYGFNLLLMQIYDGEKVFVIDPLVIEDLSPLKDVMESNSVMKLLYSGSEDVALLKQFDINVKNIFDVQVAATLCNHPATNLGSLILEEFQVTIDKKLQRSDWSIRPLTTEQMLYVANDVLFLPELKNRLEKQVTDRGLSHVLDEENRALEDVGIRQHIPEISSFYYKTFPLSYCNALLALLKLRDEIARQLNYPPDRIIRQQILEQILLDRSIPGGEQAWKSFHPRVRRDKGLRDRFVRLVMQYDPSDKKMGRHPDYKKPDPSRIILSREEKEVVVRESFDPIREEYVMKFGERTGEYLVRNLKKILKGEFKSEEPTRKYQFEIFEKMKAKKSA